MASRWGFSGGESASQAGYGSGGEDSASRVRGTRRRKLAAMAGSVYRAGVAAASEIRDSYGQVTAREAGGPEGDRVTIPGSFPNAAIVMQGDEQMVLFPSYAKRHRRQYKDDRPLPRSATQASMDDDEYWKLEWAKMEDKKAVVDVDVRGWVYSPHKGPMTRRNRILIGLARKLSGIPPPSAQEASGTGFEAFNEDYERLRDQRRIMREAEEIERRGQDEKEVANRGGYSERPQKDESDSESFQLQKSRSGSRTPISAPTSPVLAAQSWRVPAELTEAELAVANANLMARVAPFMTNPLTNVPVTLFFYNEDQSQSRTVMTTDAGHFTVRAALDFVPTNVKVLANESLTASNEIQIIDDAGVSLISDIDDTIKRSNISHGAKEIFRNTFIRDLGDLAVDGVREWYTLMHELGVPIHYCSNSPWQLYPMLATFFHVAQLPRGTIHLKQYSGMLQGIFEPVAERKKGTLEKIMRDFPERKFVLVGDSGEADLEVYTELAVANPGRILAVFIRDVTTPPDSMAYFDGFHPGNSQRHWFSGSSRKQHSADYPTDDATTRPNLPARIRSEPTAPEGLVTGSLIDISDEPEEMTLGDSEHRSQLTDDLKGLDVQGKKRPPPRPAKPATLRGQAATAADARGLGIVGLDPTTHAQSQPKAHVRAPSAGRGLQNALAPHPLTQMQNSSDPSLRAGSPANGAPGRRSKAITKSDNTAGTAAGEKPPPPPPRRRGTPSSFLGLSPRLLARRTQSSNSDILQLDSDMLPEPAATNAASLHSTSPQTATSALVGSLSSRSASRSRSTPTSPTLSGSTTPNGAHSPSLGKKIEMWRRRLQRAHEVLDREGVRLYTWRRGEDVVAEAEGIVRAAQDEVRRTLEREGRGSVGNGIGRANQGNPKRNAG